MAENAALPARSSQTAQARPRVPRRNEGWLTPQPSDAQRDELTDLSVDPEVAQQLEHSNHFARIRVCIPNGDASTYRRYVDSHLEGRGAFVTIKERTLLDILYSVDENSPTAIDAVTSFAEDILRVLGLPESALLVATIRTMDDERMRRVMIAAGVQPPELRLV